MSVGSSQGGVLVVDSGIHSITYSLPFSSLHPYVSIIFQKLSHSGIQRNLPNYLAFRYLCVCLFHVGL